MRDPLLIIFASQGGDAGKTMLATAVATELAQRFDTVLIDADHEHRRLGWSAFTWAEQRRAKHPHRDCPHTVTADSGDEAAALLEEHASAEFILIDCPSRAGMTTFKIAALADLVVLPIATGPKFPISRNTVTAMLQGIPATRANGLRADIPAIPPEQLAIVPTRCHSHAEATAAHAWLEAHCPLSERLHIHPPIMELQNYPNAVARGLAITEASPASLSARALAVTQAIIAQAIAIKPTALKRLETAA